MYFILNWPSSRQPDSLTQFLNPVMSSSENDCTPVSQQAVTCFCFDIQSSIMRLARWRYKAPY